jgi:serine protease Do
MLSSLIGLIAVLNSAAAAPEDFTQAILEQAQERLSPAIAVLRFSSEITNPNSGETSKRDGNSLALLVSPDGLAMTHGHLVTEGSEPFSLTVRVGQGENEKEYKAVTLKKPDDLNVVFLRLQSDQPLHLPYVRFAQPHGLRLGSRVAVFGLLGEALDHARGLTEDRIGAVIDKPRTTYCLESSMRFGFVGGPVIDTEGRPVGVVGFDLSRTEGGDLYARSGHALVYQSELFQKYIDHPPSETEIRDAAQDAWLGVFTQPLKDDFAEYWNLPKNGGLIVSTIVTPSPAGEVGMQRGDIITSFNGIPIVAKQDQEVLGFTKLVREAGAGQDVKVEVLREGQPMAFQVKLGVRPRSSKDAAEFEEEVFGFTVREITTDMRLMLNLGEEVKGVIIYRVKSGSPAQLARMQRGVIIMSFGGHQVASIEDFKAAVQKVSEEKPAEVSVFARAGSATGFFRLEPRWKP